MFYMPLFLRREHLVENASYWYGSKQNMEPLDKFNNFLPLFFVSLALLQTGQKVTLFYSLLKDS